MIDPLPTLRVARPTNNVDALLPFYRDGLGFKILTRFEDHDYFSGVMLGHPRAPWHLEFTWSSRHSAPRCISDDLLMVLYLPTLKIWQAANDKMMMAGFAAVASLNPYWDKLGCTYEDADGYRVVLQHQSWTL